MCHWHYASNEYQPCKSHYHCNHLGDELAQQEGLDCNKCVMEHQDISVSNLTTVTMLMLPYVPQMFILVSQNTLVPNHHLCSSILLYFNVNRTLPFKKKEKKRERE